MFAFVIAASLAAPAHVALATPDVAKLAQSRADAAAKAYASAQTSWKAGMGTIETVCAWSARWLMAAVDAAGPGKTATQAFANHLARMQDAEKQAQLRYKAGLSGPTEVDAIAYYRAEAELWQARGKTD